MKRLNLVLVSLGIIFVIFNLYTKRSLIFSKFDKDYWQDRYDHSQWRLPLSPRTIGDDGLYLYEGYLLIQGADPTLYNAEVPPLGKYLIGTSIKIFGNATVYSLTMGLLTILLLYFLVRLLTRNHLAALISATLFLFDPLLNNQLWISMLDSLQLNMLLLFFILFVLLYRSHKFRTNLFLSLLLGITLGLFAETKIGLYIPLLFIIAVWIIFHKKNVVFLLLMFGIGLGVGYLSPYIPYFFQRHTLSEWISVQKWIVNFYRGNLLTPKPGNILTTLFFNKHQNLYTGIWETSHEWSAVWPFVTILGVIGFLKNDSQSKERLVWKILVLYILIMFIILNLIPFWARYLLLLLPFFYIGTALFLISLKKPVSALLFLVILGVNLIFTLPLIFPSPNQMLTQFVYAFEKGYFHDVYEFIDQDTQTHISRIGFHRVGSNAYYDGEIEAVEIEVGNYQPSNLINRQKIPFSISYCTRNLGCFDHSTEISVVKENGKWVVKWQWDYLFPGFSENSKLKTGIELSKRGSIIDQNNRVLVADLPSSLILITPQALTDDQKDQLFANLVRFFDQKLSGLDIQLRLYLSFLPEKAIPIGTTPKKLNPKQLSELEKFPAVKVISWPMRQYPTATEKEVGIVANFLYKDEKNLLYSPTAYLGTTGLEKDFDQKLRGRNGGTLEVIDQNGSFITSLISAQMIDGQNIRLD